MFEDEVWWIAGASSGNGAASAFCEMSVEVEAEAARLRSADSNALFDLARLVAAGYARKLFVEPSPKDES